MTGPDDEQWWLAQYSRAVEELDRQLDDDIARVRGRQAAGVISALQAANERVVVLEAHLAARRDLRARLLGGQP